MYISEEWAEPIRRECGAVRQKRLADGVLIQTCTLKMGHEGNHDPLGGTATTTAWNTANAIPVWP